MSDKFSANLQIILEYMKNTIHLHIQKSPDSHNEKSRKMKVNLGSLFNTNKFAVIACLAAIIVSIAAFSFLATILPLGFAFVIASNLVTIIFMILMYKPANKLFDKALTDVKEAAAEHERKLMGEKRELERQVDDLTDKCSILDTEKNRLKSELDSIKQYTSLKRSDNFVLKVETMDYEKCGYVVKEENVRDSIYGKDIPKDKMWQFNDKGEQKVLFIKKYHEKAVIGIDLSKIKFCRKNDKIYLESVSFCNLHPELSIKREENTVNHCLILNTDENDVLSINNGSKYDDYKGWYSNERDVEFNSNFEEEVEKICISYTRAFKETLKGLFPQLEFVGGKIEENKMLEDCMIYSLKSSKEMDIRQLSDSMIAITSTMNQTMPLKF